MANSLFRFVTVRPPARIPPDEQPPKVLTHPVQPGAPTSIRGQSSFGEGGGRFLAALVEARSESDRAEMRRLSRTLIDSADFVSRREALSTPVRQIDVWLLTQHDRPSLNDLEAKARELLGDSIGAAVRSDAYASDRMRVADSLLATYLAAERRPRPRPDLTRAIRIFGLLEVAAADRNRLAGPGAIARALTATVVLPDDLYPLPRERSRRETDADSGPGGDSDEGLSHREDRVAAVQARLAEINTAIEDLVAAYNRDRLDDVPAEGSTGTLLDRPTSEMVGAEAPNRPTERRFRAPFLSAARQVELDVGTRRALSDVKIPLALVRVPSAVARLEAEAATISRSIQVAGESRPIVRIGNSFLPSEVILGTDVVIVEQPTLGLPGVCAPGLSDDPIQSPTTFPAGSVLSASLGDLMIVEQDLQRYELREIAHIENVLIGETKQRTHRVRQTVEDTLLIETEVTTETERDLQSTERFELQNETQQVIRDDTSREAGVTMSGSYGWVDFTADARYARETAREQSQASSSTYARDVTERAISRVQERVREQRTRRSVQEVEETNVHTLDNAGGQAHIVGIYRWVDKIYRAQLVNYGRRAMFEFVIPQPSAFLKFSASARPVERLNLVRPDPPGFCSVGNQFTPLRPQDIVGFGPFNYLYWAGRYHAATVDPPPPRFRIVATAFGERVGEVASATAETTIEMPPGYLARRAWLTGTPAAVDPGSANVVFRVYLGRHEASNFNFPVTLDEEDEIVPVAVVTAHVACYGFTIEIECERSTAAYEAWQQAVYSAVMTAYLERLAAYQDRLAALQIQQGSGQLGGRNAAANRQVEQTELKRAAISILTGQHFDSFDALRMTADPRGYPQLDLAETGLEGPFIRFFEQAFEWENMVYVFYPYFWGRKDTWARDAVLDDDDVVFGHFLRAGAARLVVPARPGFEEAVVSYLRHGWPIIDEADPAAGGRGRQQPRTLVDRRRGQESTGLQRNARTRDAGGRTGEPERRWHGHRLRR